MSISATNLPIHSAVAQTYLEIGTNALHCGDVNLAQRMLRAAVKQGERSTRRDSFIAPALANLGEIHYRNGRYLKARVLYKRALTAYIAELGNEHLQVALVLGKLAELAVFCRNYTESRDLETRAIASLSPAEKGGAHSFKQQILLLAYAHFLHKRNDDAVRLQLLRDLRLRIRLDGVMTSRNPPCR